MTGCILRLLSLFAIWSCFGCAALPMRTGPSEAQIVLAKATAEQAQVTQPFTALTGGPEPEIVPGASACEYVAVDSGPALLCGYAVRVGRDCGIVSVTAVNDGARAAIVWTACREASK